MRTIPDGAPVAVLAIGKSAAAPLLRRLTGRGVVELSPYRLAVGAEEPRHFGALVVENVRPEEIGGPLNPCAAARWLLPASPLTVVNLDDPAGRRLADRAAGATLSYSDGNFRAAVIAKNPNLRWGRLEFDALWGESLLRVRLAPETDFYGALAALTCGVGLGLSLEEAVRRLQAS